MFDFVYEVLCRLWAIDEQRSYCGLVVYAEAEVDMSADADDGERYMEAQRFLLRKSEIFMMKL